MNAPARVRAAFKAAGFNTRQVSVASPRGNVKVTVRSLLVPFAWAKELAGQAESVRYCEASGEMLLGGNTFVDVEHSELCRNQLAARYLGVVIETAEKVLKCDDGSGYSIPGVTRPDGQPIHLMRHHYWLRVCDGQFGACDYDRPTTGTQGATSGCRGAFTSSHSWDKLDPMTRGGCIPN